MGCASSSPASAASTPGEGKPPVAQTQSMPEDEEDLIPRRILAWSNLPDYEVIIAAAAPAVVVVAVQYEYWSLEQLKPANQRAGDSEIDLASVGLFNQAASGSVSLADVLADKAIMAFLKWLTTYVVRGQMNAGRIELLGCSTGEGTRGADFMQQLETATGVTWAASADPTGVDEDAESVLGCVTETESENSPLPANHPPVPAHRLLRPPAQPSRPLGGARPPSSVARSISRLAGQPHTQRWGRASYLYTDCQAASGHGPWLLPSR